MGPEAKLYQKIKKASPNILWNRIENLSIPGMPDALGYNKRNVFFTVEFKIAKGNKIKFSPHQIASRGPWSKVLENFFTIPVPWFKNHGA
jgi:Holliday junction resolvase